MNRLSALVRSRSASPPDMRAKPHRGGFSAPCALWACIGEDGRYCWARGIRYWVRLSQGDPQHVLADFGYYRRLAILGSLLMAGATAAQATTLGKSVANPSPRARYSAPSTDSRRYENEAP